MSPNQFFEQFMLAFIPLFVAIDILGVVPLYISFTSGMSEAAKRRLLSQSTLTALVISLLFLFAGKIVFSFLGITADDFRIGGGIVLLILAITDLLFSQNEQRRAPNTQIGIVPLGIPLIMGPAGMTTIIMLTDSYGYLVTLSSLLVNLLIVWLVFRNVKFISHIIGEGGAKAVAKVAALFLAAIAIMMIRVGVTNVLVSFKS